MPVFLMAAVIISVTIFYLRSKSATTGLNVGQDVTAPVEQIPNVTQRLNQQIEGTYDPIGSTATSASYPGVI